MSITVLEQPKLRKLAILGRLEHADECRELLTQLHALGGEATDFRLELDFYDADTLPGAVIEVLSELLDSGIQLKVAAYHPLLGHSLARVGLPVTQVLGDVRRPILRDCRALAIAGSAQSLDKILHIIDNLPIGRVPVFIAQHILEDQVNLLDQLLKVRTAYRVLMPQHLTAIEAGTVYVAPPGHHMKVAHGLVYLTRDRKIQFARPSIDALFESLAGEYGDRSLSVLLCGFGRDGVSGCEALQAAGACVLIEDGDECEPARALPDNARNAGVYTHILKCSAIASIAAAAVCEPDPEPAGHLLELFLQAICHQYGYDFSDYQHDSLQRRIHRLVLDFGLDNFADFQRAVLSEYTLFQRLLAELSVGVTRFFRHPEQFLELRQEILPYLDSFPAIRIWSAGCSTGEEAYSLAILLDELGLLKKSWIFATDINPYLLELAKSGLFPIDALAANRENYLASGGSRLFDVYVKPHSRFLKVEEHVRERILFYHHSLTHEGVFNEFQLILCRNVLIYFDAKLQAKVLQHFARSLHNDGFLLLGPQDGLRQIAQSQGFKSTNRSDHVYRKSTGDANG